MQSAEDKLFEARLTDAVRLSERRPTFMGFLDLGERAVAEDYIRKNHVTHYRFFGGAPDLERTVLGFFPDYLEPEDDLFPITPITVTYRKQDVLSHSDFLGTFLGQGVVRAAIGDILIEEGRAVLFVKSELADYFLEQVVKIRRVGVSVAAGYDAPLPAAHTFQPISGVIASPRLDCLVAFLAKTSREKASQMISAGLVSVNHREATSGSVHLEDGDILSIRKCGRFILDSLGSVTKKGRLSIKCRKYI